MLPYQLHEFFHRLNLAPHRSDTPVVQETSRPVRTLVLPESFEVLLHQVRPDHPQVVTHQHRQFFRLVVRQILRILQENILALRQDRLTSLFLELPHVFLSRFIDRVRQMTLHMEPVKDVQRLRTNPADHLQVRLPHVAANPFDLFRTFVLSLRALIELLEKSLQCRLGTFLLNAEQSLVFVVELINERRIVLSLMNLDFIHAKRFDPLQVPVFQAPIDDPLNRSIDLAEGRPETFRDFRPTQSPRPIRKELALFDGLRVLAVAPGNLFRNNAVFRTVDATHSVHEINGNRPKGHELPPTMFLGGVVGRAGLVAFRADSFAVFAGFDFHDDVLLVGRFSLGPNFSEDEGLVIGDGIEYSLQLHLGLFVRGIVLFSHTYSTTIDRDVFNCYTVCCPAKRRQALLRSNLSRNSRSKDVTSCHEPQVVRRLGAFLRPHSCLCLKKPNGEANSYPFYPLILL